MSEQPCDVTVLVPVLNERESLERLFEELRSALSSCPGLSWEVIFIDDGSSDGSQEVLRRLAEAHPDVVRALELARNYGQTAALDAGIRHASGQVLVPIDADLQNDPQDIPLMLAEIAKGADLVSGWRRRRADPLLRRRVPSFLANRLIAWLTKVSIHDFGCTLKAYRRHVLANVRLYGEMHRFIPAYAAWNGARVVEVEVHHRPRIHGRSKYGLVRTFKVVLDLITVLFLQTGYAARPLHLFGGAGLGMIVLAFSLAGLVLYQKLQHAVTDPRHIFVHRNPLATLATLVLILGTGAIALGLIAELLARIYHSTAGMSYSLAGGRNLSGVPTPEETRRLSPALEGLASRSGDAPPQD